MVSILVEFDPPEVLLVVLLDVALPRLSLVHACSYLVLAYCDECPTVLAVMVRRMVLTRAEDISCAYLPNSNGAHEQRAVCCLLSDLPVISQSEEEAVVAHYFKGFVLVCLEGFVLALRLVFYTLLNVFSFFQFANFALCGHTHFEYFLFKND